MYELDKRRKSRLNQEIDALIKKNDGMVTKDMIVKEAQKKNTALHEHFEKKGLFEPAKAMRFAQLTYAGIIINQYKVWVSVEEKEPVKIRALVSLTTDRKGSGAYRPIVSVFSDEEKRMQMLDDAKREMTAFRKKYSILSELAPVFEAMAKI